MGGRILGFFLAWPVVAACAPGNSGPVDGSSDGSAETTSSDPTASQDVGPSSMSSTSAAATSDGESSSSSPSPTDATGVIETSTDASEGGEAESTGEPVGCAAHDSNDCFVHGCVLGYVDGDMGCRAPFDAAQCAAFVEAAACATAYCDWDLERSTCGVDEDDDCASFAPGLECIYSQCIETEAGCFDPGTLPCEAIEGTIDCVRNLCMFTGGSPSCV